MKKFWNIVSIALAAGALMMAMKGDYDKAFIGAALGAVAWFLGYRVQMKERIQSTEPLKGNDHGFDSDEV